MVYRAPAGGTYTLKVTAVEDGDPELPRRDRRVPSMELAPAKQRYPDAKSAYRNFEILLERVNENDVEQSKLLRKPLNAQSGKEDGHQGGRRFAPNDRGYEIIRCWVLDAPRLKGTTGSTSARR